ncbi:hypothetical protein PMZ80_008825 [Knufia obscura]|uniref:Uncharacterized protein n=1 Tax=Knufia obscura TaxID=1635080 RepID=A0ABR0REU6_9EURO|nr:hypothetical protein PMZ80_008825 [Knufia obscura]
MSTSHCVITSPRTPGSLTAWKTTTSLPSSRSAPDLRAWKNERDIWAAAAAEARPRRRIDGTVVRRASARSGREQGESSRSAVPQRWVGRVGGKRCRTRVVASSSNSDTTEGPSSLLLDSYESVPPVEMRYDSSGSEASANGCKGNDKDKGKERAHRTPGLKGRLPTDRREREAEKARGQVEVRLATERLIARENAQLAIGRLEELESGESSESVDDESSDDENPPSIVGEVLLADVSSGTSLYRLNSNTARSEVAVMVGPEPKQSWKACLKIWVRRVFCVPDGGARKARKLQKERRK